MIEPCTIWTPLPSWGEKRRPKRKPVRRYAYKDVVAGSDCCCGSCCCELPDDFTATWSGVMPAITALNCGSGVVLGPQLTLPSVLDFTKPHAYDTYLAAPNDPSVPCSNAVAITNIASLNTWVAGPYSYSNLCDECSCPDPISQDLYFAVVCGAATSNPLEECTSECLSDDGNYGWLLIPFYHFIGCALFFPDTVINFDCWTTSCPAMLGNSDFNLFAGCGRGILCSPVSGAFTTTTLLSGTGTCNFGDNGSSTTGYISVEIFP